jgi:hypothetical protein
MYENWELDADRKAEDARYGWEALADQLAEDEEWARYTAERQVNTYMLEP